MTEKQFWYGDTRLLEVYRKAYTRNISYNAWLQGQQNYLAQSIALSNAFAKKGQKPIEYPQWKDPMQEVYKPKIDKNNLEEEFRKKQSEQQAWLFHK